MTDEDVERCRESVRLMRAYGRETATVDVDMLERILDRLLRAEAEVARMESVWHGTDPS